MDSNISLSSLYKEALKVCEDAVEHDRRGDARAAWIEYERSLYLLRQIAHLEKDPARLATVRSKIIEFGDRTSVLEEELTKTDEALENGLQAEEEHRISLTDVFDCDDVVDEVGVAERPSTGAEETSELGRDSVVENAKKVWRRAESHETRSEYAVALQLYQEAASGFLDRLRSVAGPQRRFLEETLNKILDRAEAVKTCLRQNGGASVRHDGGVASPQHIEAARGYSKEEINVLRRTSVINGRVFLPWMPNDATQNLTAGPLFSDKDLPISLARRQQEKLYAWMRPKEFVQGQPVMIKEISARLVTQDLVTDCSFVASLCITAAYEARFRKQLITRTIYPQSGNGQPLYNPRGKYFVKLWLNGVPRRVVVDDRLPVGRDRKLLCSYSAHRDELWVSIIEKAYMKVNGGYDFLGSNSGIDLYALTGWIPETVHFGSDLPATEAERIWQRLVSAHEFGDCLITISTGQMSEQESESLGLVASHAYAVLAVKEIDGVKLLQVKNPWSRVVWKGPYSPLDTGKWTEKMCSKLKYNARLAATKDIGVFWIDYASVQRHFRGLFMNWNPELFSHREAVHRHWPVSIGPKNDTYNVGYNPQYSLIVRVPPGHKKGGAAQRLGSVWILLTRHIVNKDTISERDYMTLHVYANTGGQRVYYPAGALHRGTYSNNPHVLTCLDVPEGHNTFTLVVSQYEKINPINYSLAVFSTEPFSLEECQTKLKHTTRLTGMWNGISAGGPPRSPNFINNPQWRLEFNQLDTRAANLHIRVEAPIQFAVNTRVHTGAERIGHVSAATEVLNSGDYRQGFCYVEKLISVRGPLVIIPSTFQPGQEGSFILTIATSTPHKVTGIPADGDGLHRTEYTKCWSVAQDNAGGNLASGTYHKNPKLLLRETREATLMVRLIWLEEGEIPAINVSVWRVAAGSCVDLESPPLFRSNDGIYTNPSCGVATPRFVSEYDNLFVVASTHKSGIQGRFKLVVFSDRAVNAAWY